MQFQFTHAFSALRCVFIVLTLIEPTNVIFRKMQCGKRMHKWNVATWLELIKCICMKSRLPGNLDDPSGLVGVVALEDEGEPVAGVDRSLPIRVAVDDSRARKIFATCEKNAID